MIEFWLTFNNNEESIWLHIPPPSFEIQTGLCNSTVTLHELGELMLTGKRRLKTVSLSSYFPVVDDGLGQYKSPKPPKELVKMIENWRDSQKPMRLLIFGKGLVVNEAMVIENFSYSQKNGPEDVYFTLDLKEYRFVKVKTTPLNAKEAEQLRPRPSDRGLAKTYTVQPGDTLKKIAKKVYGDESRSITIKETNHITSEYSLKVGMQLKIG
ncbi:LysM peptidoglycan-binding domain-containing protein [Paenibacillus guangzhouensis]|uniref:LysM peptidoglycan-binding domain-containing protein n=1 Tax=Paenibacillus guangzhouensis TaxID=1473112 RepID=UPI0012672A1E|nr:LysM domain-containing protein [Paenibacillus guangzhouensis]